MRIKFDIYVFITIIGSIPDEILVAECTIHQLVSATALSWFIIYWYYILLKFTVPKSLIKTKGLLPQAEVTLDKTKVLLPQAYVILTDFGYPV